MRNRTDTRSIDRVPDPASPLAVRLAWLVALSGLAGAMAAGGAPSTATDFEQPELAERVVRQLQEQISSSYAYKGREAWLVESLGRMERLGRYADLDRAALGQKLTQDLRNWTADKHFMVAHMPAFAAELEAYDPASEAEAQDSPEEKAANYGIRRATMLDDYVGLIELDQIAFSPQAVPAFQKALASLPEAIALILDLRANHGGSADNVAGFASCFFARGERIKLGTKYWRPTDATTPIETRANMPGTRYHDHPVLILTSRDTRSAAEALAYHLRAFGLAYVVGERSSGGAHPADMLSLGDGFVTLMPMGLVTNARTGTDWEGRGVPVDEPCPAAQAQEVAHDLALHLLDE